MDIETATLVAEQVNQLVTPATVGKWVAIEASGEFSPTLHDGPYNAEGAAWLVLLDDITPDTIMALFNPGHAPAEASDPEGEPGAGPDKASESETAKPAKKK